MYIANLKWICIQKAGCEWWGGGGVLAVGEFRRNTCSFRIIYAEKRIVCSNISLCYSRATEGSKNGMHDKKWKKNIFFALRSCVLIQAWQMSCINHEAIGMPRLGSTVYTCIFLASQVCTDCWGYMLTYIQYDTRSLPHCIVSPSCWCSLQYNSMIDSYPILGFLCVAFLRLVMETCQYIN